jgi:two-component system sensor histidine kinase/response regulator
MSQEPIVDLRDLSEMLEHDVQKVQQLALVFLRSTRDGLAELDAALACSDIRLIRSLGHRIKASAQIVGALGMVQLCEDLEQLPITDIDTEKASAGAIVAQLHPLLAQAGELILQQDVGHDKN